MALAKVIDVKSRLPSYRARLRDLMPDIMETAPEFDFHLGLDTVTWATQLNRLRDMPRGELFSDPLTLTQALVNLVGADAETIYAAILYPSIRPNIGSHFDATYLDEISVLFKDHDGAVKGHYLNVKDLAVNALQLRACDLVAPPYPIETIEQAFDKPTQQEAENIGAYFVLSKSIIKDERAFAIRATQWYLKLVDMRENPTRYTQEDRLNAYYYTDKFYAPFCEYMALQKLKTEPSYSPQAEGKGLYRLKTAMDEELIRQINPEAYRAIQGQLLDILRGFDVEKGHRKVIPENRKLFDLVRNDLEDKMRAFVTQCNIPLDYVRIETRLKKPRSIYQKVRAGRTDIHDYIGVRLIVDIDKLRGCDGISAALDKNGMPKFAKHTCGKLAAALSKVFEQVPGRYRNFYVSPYFPDNGYRTVQNTFKIFGQDVEVQIVDLPSHINNSIGPPAHFFHKLVGDKKGEKKTGLSTAHMMAAFRGASNCVVVRTTKGLFVLKAGATAAKLAKRIHTALAADAVSAIVTDYDPIHRLDRVRVSLNAPLRSGQFVHIETDRALVPAAP